MDGESGSNVWKYVGIGCGVSLLLALCAVGSCFACGTAAVGGLVAATGPAVEAAEGFVEDVRAGAPETAYGRTSSDFQNTVTIEQFRAATEILQPITQSSSHMVTARNLLGADRAMIGVMLIGDGQPRGQVLMHVVQEGGAWRVQALSAGASQLGHPLTLAGNSPGFGPEPLDRDVAEPQAQPAGAGDGVANPWAAPTPEAPTPEPTGTADGVVDPWAAPTPPEPAPEVAPPANPNAGNGEPAPQPAPAP